MAAADTDDGDRLPVRVTSYAYDGGPLAPVGATLTTWTRYDSIGRVIARGTGEPPDDPDAGPPDEPHNVG